MNGESLAHSGNEIVGRIEEIQKRLETDQEFSRRSILKGLGVISFLTVAQGLSAIERLDSTESLQAVTGDICPDYDVRCILEPSEIGANQAVAQQVNPNGVLVNLVVSPETTLSPEVPVTAPPQPPAPPAPSAPPPPPTTTAPPPPEVLASSLESLREPERRNMSFEEFLLNAEQYMNVLPRLEQMNALFPNTAFFHFIPEQLQHIANLKEATQTTVEKYNAFAYDTTHSGTFNQTKPLSPRAFLWHWTGWHYESPDVLKSMKPNSVQLYVHNNAKAYQMVPQLDVVAGHARVMNDFTWGMEMYSGSYDEVHSPLFNFIPPQVETGIYAAVRQLRSHNLPVSKFTILGHYAADLIFMNPYYDPALGTFHQIPGHKPIGVHKFDPPQEFIDMAVEKAIALDLELGPR